MDGLGCEVSLDRTLVIVYTKHKEAFIIAPINMEKNSRLRTPDEFRAMPVEAAITSKEGGLVMMRPVYDIYGEIRIVATRSDPGRGIFSLFNGCEAR